MSRTQAREIAYKMLFSNQFLNNGFEESVFVEILDGQKCSETDMEFIKSIVVGVQEHSSELQEIISRNLSAYKFERLFSADKVALLLCVYEMIYCQDTPKKVAINETLNLVKKYSTEKSVAFVNSVLSKIYKEISNE
ncbi:MAG: transcription antitermination factor NusB [Clostridia bacterium]|nr:transcription antitermination factor NusB [Clostridia bacterium]